MQDEMSGLLPVLPAALAPPNPVDDVPAKLEVSFSPVPVVLPTPEASAVAEVDPDGCAPAAPEAAGSAPGSAAEGLGEATAKVDNVRSANEVYRILQVC